MLWAALVGLTVFATLARFFFLEVSPPGFYIDEAAISAQIICLRQSGADLAGHHLPLFTQVLGGGFATPPYLYSGALWTSFFGDSVASFRGLTAFYSSLFIAGLYVFGTRFWKSQRAGFFCSLAGAISPWASQFARIAWDPAIAPALSVWAFALLWADGKRARLQSAAGGILLSLAAYSYPPLRLQLAIVSVFAFVVLFVVEKRDWRRGALSFTTAFLFSLPLLSKTLSGELQGRFSVLSVFNADYLRQFGEPTWSLGVRELLKNLALNFSPNYLFFSGDSNLRHSIQTVGEWSWLDIFAVGIALGFFVLSITRGKLKSQKWSLIVFIVIGYVAGVLPAALTWESNPHALRSIGALVFLSLGVGGSLARAWDYKILRFATASVSFAFTVFFFNSYARVYPQISGAWFDESVTETAKRLKSENRTGELSAELRRAGIEYDAMAISYYELAAKVKTCRDN